MDRPKWKDSNEWYSSFKNIRNTKKIALKQTIKTDYPNEMKVQMVHHKQMEIEQFNRSLVDNDVEINTISSPKYVRTTDAFTNTMVIRNK